MIEIFLSVYNGEEYLEKQPQGKVRIEDTLDDKTLEQIKQLNKRI